MTLRDPCVMLIVLAASIGASVQHFAAPPGGIRAPRDSDGDGNPTVRVRTVEYPRVAIDSDSFVVRSERPAKRIVSQYWSIDDFVYTVAPADHVVAVSQTAFLPSVSNVFDKVKQYKPVMASDPETVLRRDPDLMIVSHSSRADYCAIVREADIPIYRAFTTFTTLEQVADTIRLTGYLTGDDRKAALEVARFWSEIDRAVARRPANAPHPRILGLAGHSGYGSETLFDDIVQRLGGINVGAEGGAQGYTQISSEQLVRWDPEWIVSESDPGKAEQTRAKLLADPGVAVTQAARNGHILVFEHRVFLPMSPFTSHLVSAIAEGIYE